ncbi:hypothetical protein CK203_023672 [Vitis vinifera]|uniref:Endonuclease/exonuclease/phosphatase domain-containing protein n=1 Tax=Vitis vinifera TaxID=29760 RepID=A0A438JBP9_VITVI|nr:hypothetical protein CK203_023672 [Vitis vinifera]
MCQSLVKYFSLCHTKHNQHACANSKVKRSSGLSVQTETLVGEICEFVDMVYRQTGAIDLVCLQETKIKEIKVGIVRSLSMGRCLEWGAANLRGTAGGVMVFWDNRIGSHFSRAVQCALPRPVFDHALILLDGGGVEQISKFHLGRKVESLKNWI